MDMSANITKSDAVRAVPRKQPLANLLPPVTTGGEAKPRPKLLGTVWPHDAYAIVEPIEPSVTQSPRRSRRGWKVRFAPRSAPFVDPLTGWTGGRDPLQHVELRFPSLDAAQGYLERQGLPYRVRHAGPIGQTATIAKESDQ